MTTQIELDEFRADVRAWLADSLPADPGFLLPETFMEVGTDQQFEFLRDWQRTVYEAGYLGMAWPSEYGGGGQPQVCLLYTSPSPRDATLSRMPSSA